MKISVCIITFNEEENIRRCLSSCSMLADEIVIVDSGSTDATQQIALEFNCKFYHQDWLGYVAQKNKALELASNEWILSLDADEALSPELQAEIMREKSIDQPESVAGFSMPRCVYYEGKWIRHGDWYPDRVVRLFRKTRARFVGGKVHERLQLNGNVKKLYGDIYHYSFKNQSDHIERCEKYARLWAEEKFETGVNAGILSPYFHAAFRWFRGYILRAGFLDGKQGFKIAYHCARETFLKYKILRELNRSKSNR